MNHFHVTFIQTLLICVVCRKAKDMNTNEQNVKKQTWILVKPTVSQYGPASQESWHRTASH